MSEELVAGMLVDDRYQLLFRLGKGGMGEVWAAAQSQSEFGFQKLVALKVLRSAELHSNAAVMFFDEAKAASALQHHAIVSTIDLGHDGDILFIAMDMVRGPSLTALLQRLVINKRRVSPSIVAHIGMQISSALDYAHNRVLADGQKLGLVHRDVSPHNVLLDLNISVKLTDFGVARTTIQSHQSHVGTVRGKPSYMAPEQVVGGDIDGRTDLFALGIVLYETSCLKRLFGRSNPVKSMDAVMKHTPKPLPELVPGYPEPMWAVIRKALQKNPNDRFQSAAEMFQALEAASRGLDDTASAPRDLVDVIEKNFEPDAFDIDSRVKEVLDEVGGAPVPIQGLPAPTSSHDGDLVVKGIDLPQGGTMVAWPTAHAPDPLAPEAIEEARTQFRALTPSASVSLSGMQPMSLEGLTPSHASIDGFTPVLTGTGNLPPPSDRKRWIVPALAISTAAILMAGTVWVVISSRSAVSATTELRVPSPVVPTPSKAPEVSQKKPPAPPPVAAPTYAENEQPTKRVEPIKRRSPRRAKPAPEKARVADATFAEVQTLVNRVKEVDPKRGRAMYPTLIEAGRDNTAKLNQLRREAKAILAKPRDELK